MTAVDVRTPVAAAVATVLGSLALTPVLSSGTWRRPAVVAVLVVLLTGLALRSAGALISARAFPGRPVPPALAALGAVLVPVGQLAALTAHLTRRFTDVGNLLPTPAGVEALNAVLRDGTDEIREQVAPALPVLGLTALVVLFVGLVALVVDLVAVGARQASLAGPVLLVLVGVPVFTLGGDIGLLPVVAPAAGLAVLLWADQSRRLDDSGRTAGRRVAGGGAAVRIALAAVLVGVIGGGMLPTRAEGTLSGGPGGAGSTGTGLDPVAAMYGELTRNDPVDLLRLQASVADPGYLRAVTVDLYDVDDGWTLGDPQPQVPLRAQLPRTHERETGRPVFAEIEVVGHDDRFLPLPVTPMSVRMDGGENGWRFDTVSGTAVGADVTTGGRRYAVTASEVRPTPEQLQAAPPLRQGSLVQERFTDLPTLDPRVYAQVGQLVDGVEGGYARVRAILDFLTDSANGFTYALSTAPGTSDDDLLDFLTERRGYCEQYAGAMAVMVRAAGMPARVALGYTPGTALEDGTRLITSDDAHAWVEVFFSGYGWVPFDPTPIDVDRRAELPWAPRVATEELPQQTPLLPEFAPDLSLVDPLGPLGPDPGGFDREAAAATPDGRSWPSRLGLGLLAAATAVVPAGMRLLQRRRRLADGTAQALWDELTATADDLGVGRDPAWTPREAGRALAERTTDAEGAAAIARLARAEELASYGPAAGAPDAELGAALRTARRALRGSVERRARLRAAFWPASLPAALVAGVPTWARRRPALPRAWRRGARRV